MNNSFSGLSHPVMGFAIPVLHPHVLRLSPFIDKVPVAVLTVVVLGAISVVLIEAFLA